MNSLGRVIVVVSLFLPLHVRAWDSSAIVKTNSYPCGERAPVFHGSGLAFSWGGKSYVLTSEHVVLHGNHPYCHSVANSQLGVLKAQLKAVEYGNGLALLELDEPNDTLPLFEDFKVIAGKEEDTIYVTGFPFSEKLPILRNPGRILVAKSSRKLIPMLPQMLETIAAHGEFGMSGGPVVNIQREWVGVLSHQYVRLIPGQRSRVLDFSEKSEIENHLLIIPASVASTWINGVLKHNDRPQTHFMRDPAAQLKKKEVVLSAGLRFEWIRGQNEPSPVGGADGAGTGGADGAGAGGDDQASNTEHKESHVRISLDPTHTSTVWYLPQFETWLTKVRQELLLPWQSIQVPLFLVEEKENIQAIPITSLADFFQKLAQPDLEAVTTIHSTLNQSEDTELVQVGQLAAIGKKLLQVSEALRKSNEELPSESQAMLSKIDIAAKLFANKSWSYIKLKQLDALCDVKARSAAWAPLFKDHFELAVDLLEQLNKARTLMGELRL